MENRIKISDNFYLDEFVHPDVYNLYKESSIRFLDKRIIEVGQLLRTLVQKPIVINSWYNGGRYKSSGLRKLSSTVGASMSQHKFGRAIDVKVKGMTTKEVQEFILENEKEFMKAGLTRLESCKHTATWNHLDCATTNKDKIQVFNP